MYSDQEKRTIKEVFVDLTANRKAISNELKAEAIALMLNTTWSTGGLSGPLVIDPQDGNHLFIDHYFKGLDGVFRVAQAIHMRNPYLSINTSVPMDEAVNDAFYSVFVAYANEVLEF